MVFFIDEISIKISANLEQWGSLQDKQGYLVYDYLNLV